jgi:hypothetical protein
MKPANDLSKSAKTNAKFIFGLAPCMNPASVIWPDAPRDAVSAQQTRRQKLWAEGPVTILNKGWKPTP